MPMREECKQYESRTYANGETVRKCNLDLAPEAPWRCPANCSKFELRLADVDWSHGSLISSPPPPEPDPDVTKGRCGPLDDVLSAKYGAAFSAEAGRVAMEKFPLEQVMQMCEAWAQLPQAELEAKLASELGLKPTK